MSTIWLGGLNDLADGPGRPMTMPVFAGQKLVVVGGSSGMGRQAAADVVADATKKPAPPVRLPSHPAHGPPHPGYTPAGNAGHNNPGRNEHMVAWDRVTDTDVLRAIQEYDRLGPEQFFAAHGFGPTTTYDLIKDERRYPPKAILGTAYEFATGQRLDSGDFEGGKSGAVAVLGKLGFTVQHKQQPARQS